MIDAFAIMDTGSSDNTIQEIESALEGVPGRIEKMDWVGFAASRNAAIRLAQGLGEYLMFVDADDMVVLESHPDDIKKQLTATLHPVLIKHGPITYDRLLFRSINSESEYHFAVHEVLIPTKEDVIGAEISGLHVVHNAIGLSARNKQEIPKTRLDAQVIEDELAKGVEPLMKPRYQFYLAQSYRDCGEVEKAIDCYRTRASMRDGWNQERYVSALECGKLIGHGFGSPGDQLMWFRKAIEIDHHRAEAYFEIALLARREMMWRLAFETAMKASELPFPTRALFARPEIYDWQAMFEVSISAYYVGENNVGRNACEQILCNPNVPDQIKKLTLENQKYYLN